MMTYWYVFFFTSLLFLFNFQQIAAVNLLEKPCFQIIDKLPPRECFSQELIEWQRIRESCVEKCNSSDEQCCFRKCIFLEHGVVVDGALNITLISSWLSTNGDAKMPQILGYINHCEAIGL